MLGGSLLEELASLCSLSLTFFWSFSNYQSRTPGCGIGTRGWTLEKLKLQLRMRLDAGGEGGVSPGKGRRR
jgi:hypothetical protein